MIDAKLGIRTFYELAFGLPLVLRTRDHYFPERFAHATWQRVAPFFHLPGLVVQGPKTVCVELRLFHDRQYNRDLIMLCERVNKAAPQLPDGRRLLFVVRDIPRPVSVVQKRRVA